MFYPASELVLNTKNQVYHLGISPDDIAEKIIEKKADYVLALKGNQGNIHKAVKKIFEEKQLTNDNIIKHHPIKAIFLRFTVAIFLVVLLNFHLIKIYKII